MPERIIALSRQVAAVATTRVEEIRGVTRMAKILSLNAAIEAARAGQAGAGFSIVASEVGNVSDRINDLADQVGADLSSKARELDELGQRLVANIRGSRLADLALNMIDVVDRNLYERSCDVRWWATDSAVVDCAAEPSDAAAASHAAGRLGVILDSYTVYLDLWIADLTGRVLANGRPARYPAVAGSDVSGEQWFRDALALRDGTDFVACDIQLNHRLDGKAVATCATAVRTGGAVNGRPIGVLGIFFDWEKQSQAVVNGVRLNDEERSRTRNLLLDASHRVIASSDGQGLFERFPILTEGNAMGTYVDSDGSLVGFALTPGYETYAGLGWYGVLVQQPHRASA